MKLALRQLVRTPGFTLVALVTLALGIGANTAIFSVIKSVLLQPLPYPGFERIVAGWQTDIVQGRHIAVSYPDFLDFDRSSRSFEHLAAYRRSGFSLTGRGPAERLNGAMVTHDYFSVLGLPALHGRVIAADDDRPGAAPVALLSHRLWQSRFGSDPALVGQSITLDRQSVTIIGILPPEFIPLRNVDIWVPLAPATTTKPFQERSSHPGLFMLGKLRPEISLDAARAELSRLAEGLAQAHPATNAGNGAGLEPLLENAVGQYREGLYLLLGAVALVLLIACANLAHLFLVRGNRRTQEFAVRAALGASRGQLLRQLLGESLLIALLGGLAGVLLAFWARDLIVALAPPGIPRFQEVAIDGAVLAFSLALSVLTGVLFGLWPAWRASRTDVREALASGTRGSSGGPAARRLRQGLIVGEIALTLALLTGAGLVLKSFDRLQRTGLGFDDRNLLLSLVSLNPAQYDAPARNIFATTLLERVRALPGVERASLTAYPPLRPGWATGFDIAGRAPFPSGQGPYAEMQVVDADYFAAMRLPLLRGRGFTAADSASGATPVAIIDEAFARRHWPGEDALGQAYLTGGGTRRFEVVGIVPTVKLYGPNEKPDLVQAYIPYAQTSPNSFHLVIRTIGYPGALRQPLADLVASLDPHQPLANVRTMRDDVETQFVTPRLYAWLLSFFAGLALVLAAVGLHGVIAYSASQRTREIGIRLALGALPTQILRLILGEGIRLLVLGILLGLALSAISLRALRSLLFEVSPADPLIHAAIIFGIAAIFFLASWLPARRAAKTDPIAALRRE